MQIFIKWLPLLWKMLLWHNFLWPKWFKTFPKSCRSSVLNIANSRYLKCVETHSFIYKKSFMVYLCYQRESEIANCHLFLRFLIAHIVYSRICSSGKGCIAYVSENKRQLFDLANFCRGLNSLIVGFPSSFRKVEL